MEYGIKDMKAAHSDILQQNGFKEITDGSARAKGKRHFMKERQPEEIPKASFLRMARVTVNPDGSWKSVGEDGKTRAGWDIGSLRRHLDKGKYLVH